jgi:hypothetical protein
MGNIVRKVRPTDYWRIGEHESWFSDMSLKGLHLYKMGTHFAKFKKGTPKRMEYRIEVTEKEEIYEAQIELYEEHGWEYITSYQYFHVFAAQEENEPTELHTDPAEQSYTLNYLNKRLMFNLILISIGVLLIVGMLGAVWFLDGTPILRVVEGYVIQQTILCVIVLYNVYYSTRAMVAIQALKRNLKEGKAINHHAPWEKSLRKGTLVSIIFLFTGLISLVLPFMQIIKMETYTLPNEESNLPLVRLADIEQNPKLISDEYYIDGIDWANRYSTNWSIFAPVQYESNESGVINDLKWLDNSGIYSPGISTEIYQLSFKTLAKPLISDLIKWHSYGDEQKPVVDKNHPKFDKLIIHEDAEMKELYASKGKVVMYVRYHGYAEVDRLIELMAQKITLLTNE